MMESFQKNIMRGARCDCSFGMTGWCEAYHGAFWNILGWVLKQLQAHCGIDIYYQGNIVLLVVTIGKL
jgi:hypothetical protein